MVFLVERNPGHSNIRCDEIDEKGVGLFFFRLEEAVLSSFV